MGHPLSEMANHSSYVCTHSCIKQLLVCSHSTYVTLSHRKGQDRAFCILWTSLCSLNFAASTWNIKQNDLKIHDLILYNFRISMLLMYLLKNTKPRKLFFLKSELFYCTLSPFLCFLLQLCFLCC